ncbi:MAG TPA: DEAD/DEAH box helicase [Caulobacteraceae bacterium]
MSRSVEDLIVLDDESAIRANRFQRDFWRHAQNQGWVSASAPTSTGKSYVILQWLGDLLSSRSAKRIVYVVPTRALIQQLELDFRALVKERDLSGVRISSLPVGGGAEPADATVHIFTQERLHLFMTHHPDEAIFDALVVDEAHKVGDGHRGVLLQEVIERAASDNANIQVLFASPLTSNPESLLADAPPKSVKATISSTEVMVNQNLLWVTQVSGNPKRWTLSLCHGGGIEVLGEVALPFSPTSVGKRLPFVAHALGAADSGNLIYVDGAADAEKTAGVLYDLIGKEGDVSSSAIRDLIALSKSVIHDKYALGTVLGRGIAFHYGNMPLIIRSEIERLFREGELRFLICTSTLIEGVNLPCRNIFARGPKKGRGQPMAGADFWNLAGRAGRWGKEFQGNIVCVDANREEVWRGGAPRSRALYHIRRTADAVLEAPSGLLDFIGSGTPRNVAAASPELEYMAAYLIGHVLRAGTVSRTPWANRVPKELVFDIDAILVPIADGLSVSPETVWRNPGVSPVAMDALLTYFRERQGPVEQLLPVPPESADAASRYIAILNRVSANLTATFGGRDRIVMLGLLVTDWMRGLPLRRLIANQIRVLENRGREVRIPAVIRQVMKDVEEVARFQAPKFLSCYTDILRQHLNEIGRADLSDDFVNLNLLMEFGVPGGTQLSFMGLGLSRTTAIALAELVADDKLSEDECRDWLGLGLWEEFDLPNLVKREIRTALSLL